VLDYKEYKIKIYYISPDSRHIYITIDSIPNAANQYTLEVGNLFFNYEKLQIFEDTPNEIETLNSNEFKIVKKLYDKTAIWSDNKIKDIFETIEKMNLDLAI
jgi:hypothetical protein